MGKDKNMCKNFAPKLPLANFINTCHFLIPHDKPL